MAKKRTTGVDARLKALKSLMDSERPRSTLETGCIKRLIRDFEGEGSNGLVWKEEEAARAISFCKLLKHWKGEWGGKQFIPEPWQEHLTLAPLFGWYRETSDGLRRRFTVGYNEQARKNGKTFTAAAIALQGLMADGEAGAECYAAASTRDQAGILFKDSQNVARQTPELMEHLEFFRNSIVCHGLSSVLKPVSSEANTLHGHNIHRAVIDELHAQPNRDLWDVIQTGTAARRNPLVFAITTAGHDRSTICWEQHEYARSVLEEHHHDDTFFAFISCAELDDDPFDPATWWKANPNLDVSIKSDYLAREANKAKTSPSYENTFRRLHLSQWTEQSIRWLPMHVWDECGGPVKFDAPEYEAELIGRECYAGLDLASTRDVNSLVLVFPLDDGRYRLLPFFWVPSEAHDDRAESDRRQVKHWATQGLIEQTDGNVADLDGQIPDDVMEICSRFDVRGLFFDPWHAAAFVQGLERRGFEHARLVEFRQTVGSFAEPTKEFERLVSARKIEHGGNPVLRWMAANVAVKIDPAGNIRPDKAKSSDKIDGIVAAIMGLSGAIKPAADVNWYTPGSLTL
jgi:phage terminase large subunit-like protein